MAGMACFILDLLFHQLLERLKKITKYLINERQYMERGPLTPTIAVRYLPHQLAYFLSCN